MSVLKAEGERYGRVTGSDLDHMIETLDAEVERMRRTREVWAEVLDIPAVEIDGYTKFRKGFTEISRAVDNLIIGTKNSIPKDLDPSR